MPRGDKSSYSSKQKRQAQHIEDSEKQEGKSTKVAGRIAWATVNKTTGGAMGAKKRKSSKKVSPKKKKKSSKKKSAKKKSSKRKAKRR